MRRAFRLVPGFVIGLVAGAAGAQDIPGTSPMDHAAMSMAHTSGTIDSLTTGDVARAGRARPARRTRSPAPRRRDAATIEACRHSTPILKSMGLKPAPECL